MQKIKEGIEKKEFFSQDKAGFRRCCSSLGVLSALEGSGKKTEEKK